MLVIYSFNSLLLVHKALTPMSECICGKPLCPHQWYHSWIISHIGDPGVPGFNGGSGATGPSGASGSPGFDGPPGRTGASGSPGPPGFVGNPGRFSCSNAHEILGGFASCSFLSHQNLVTHELNCVGLLPNMHPAIPSANADHVSCHLGSLSQS